MTEQNGDITLKPIDGTKDYALPTLTTARNWLFNGRHGKIEARENNLFGDKYDLVNSFIEIKNFDLYDHWADEVDTLVLESRFSNTSALGKFVLVKNGNTYFFDMDNSTHNVVSAVKVPGQTIDFDSYLGGSNYLSRDPHHRNDKRWVQYTENDADQVVKTIENYIERGGVLKNSLSQTIVQAENVNAADKKAEAPANDPLKGLNQDGKILGLTFTTLASDGEISADDEKKIAAIGKDLKNAKIQIASDKKSALIFNTTPDLTAATVKVPERK